MTIQHSLTVSYVSPTGTVAGSFNATGDATLEQNLTIAALASSAETDMSITYTELQSFFIVANAAMTAVFKAGTGGSGATAATFTLVANVPQFYVASSGMVNPFTGNAGQVLVTSTPGGLLQIRALQQQ